MEMKVTALIPDELVSDVKQIANEKNLTECLIKALSEWTASQKIMRLNKRVSKSPLKFHKDFSAEKVRNINRK
jgi:hypothetical protein